MRPISMLLLLFFAGGATPLLAQNQVINGSFNGSIAGWESSQHPFATIGYTTEQNHSGSGSGSLRGQWNSSSLVHYYTLATQTRPVTPNTNFTFSGYIRVNIDSLSNLGSTVHVTFFTAGGEPITSRALDYVTTAGSWQFSSVNGTVPANAATMEFAATGSQTTGQISWFDDITFTTTGPAVTLTVDDASATEGSAVPFTVRREGSTASPLTVYYIVLSGTAVVGNDLPNSSGSVTIPSGSASVQVPVPTTDDANVENSETFRLHVSEHACVICQPSSPFGTGTIIDNEIPTAVSIDDATVEEGDVATFVVSRTGSTSSPVTVNYSVRSGSATLGTDLNPAFGPVTIPSGQSSVELRIATNEDTVPEPTETFTVTISAGGVNIADGSGTGTITDDDDSGGAASVSVGDASAEEGQSLNFTVARTGSTTSAVVLNYSLISGTATQGVDFGGPAAGSVTIPAGSSTAQIAVNTVEDAIVESNENFTVRLESASDGVPIADANGLGTIIDDDGTGQTVQVNAFTATPASIAPGGSSTLSWSTGGASSVTISGIAGSLPANGSTTVRPPQTTIYQLTAHSAQGATATAQVTIQVGTTTSAPVISFSANVTTVAAGDPARLTWSVSNATNVTIAPAPGAVPLNGSEDVFPGAPVFYVLTATGPGGTSTSGLVIDVTEAPARPPAIAFRASAAAIHPGESVTLTWNAANAHTVSLNGIATPDHGASTIVRPSATTVYTLAAAGHGGLVTKTVTITVLGGPRPAAQLTASPQQIRSGQSSTLHWITFGASAVCIDGAMAQLSGANPIAPQSTTTYTLRAATGSGAMTRTATVVVDELLPPRVDVLAGAAGPGRHADGIGTQARLHSPAALARDSQGNIFVADSGNHVIRRIAPDGTVSTFAGSPGQASYAEGAGDAARFRLTDFGGGLAVDTAGNLYVADSGNHVIRRISPAGVVSLFAGLPGTGGWVDGSRTEARFFSPSQLAIDTAGNLYVADSGNHTIRRITPEGNVSTYAGYPGEAGYAEGTGTAARFDLPHGLAIDSAGNLYVIDSRNDVVRTITPQRLVSTFAGTAGSPCGFQFRERGGGIAVRPGATSSAPPVILVADPGSNVVFEVGGGGSLRTLLGDGRSGDDGAPATHTSFFGPRALLGSGENLIVADTENHMVRQSTLRPLPSSPRRRACCRR